MTLMGDPGDDDRMAALLDHIERVRARLRDILANLHPSADEVEQAFAGCQHDKPDQVAPGVHWCPRCGAIQVRRRLVNPAWRSVIDTAFPARARDTEAAPAMTASVEVLPVANDSDKNRCPICMGNGKVDVAIDAQGTLDHRPCLACHGEGTLSAVRAVAPNPGGA